MVKILVTGTAGFIGFHLALRLIERGDTVVGLDNINDYYDVELKFNRLAYTGIQRAEILYNKIIQSTKHPLYSFIKLDLQDKTAIDKLFSEHQFDIVVNLAAQAGVRYSLSHPEVYIQSNIVGFFNILEACRSNPVKHLVYASSSSVYGSNTKMPFSTDDMVDHPISLYAASKKSNELMAHTYSHLFNIPTTGLRFFTVYGPWGRPDMALFIFTKAILEGKEIDVYNNGQMQRDFTYVDDIVEGIVRVMDTPPVPPLKRGEEESSTKLELRANKLQELRANKLQELRANPFKIYNIGNNNPVKLMDFIGCIEDELKIKAKKRMLPLQAGDVPDTYADVSDLVRDLGYKPETSVRNGIKKFLEWYMGYYTPPALPQEEGEL
jgi:UDP-glucuronate 4-epimerase